MKKLLVLTVVSMIGLLSFAQSSTDTDKLLKKFTKEEIKSMSIETLRFNTYCIENAFEIVDFPKEKTGDQAINGARKIENLESVNFFDLNIELKDETYQYFTVLGTDKLLIVKPIFLIKTELK